MKVGYIMKKVIYVFLCLALCICFVSCNKTEQQPLPPSNDGLGEDEIGNIQELVNSKKVEDFELDEDGDYAIVDIENYGQIVLCLRDDIAPDTVGNFKNLIKKGYYDGLLFHRVIKDFMIEGGEVNSDGVLSSTDMIYGEFASNGFENNLCHYRGVLSMSRANIPDSAMGKFFILHKDARHLDGEYAAFGYVVAGMDVVDKIAECEVGENYYPNEQVVINSIKLAKLK